MTESSHDYVSIEPTSDEVAQLLAADSGIDFGNLLQVILSDRLKVWRRLVDHSMRGDARFTLIDDSVRIDNVEIESPSSGCIHGTFQMAAYYGCRDMNGTDDGDFSLDISIDWVPTQPEIRVGAKRREPDRDTFEEF